MPLIDTEVQDGLLTVRKALDGECVRLTLTGEMDLSNVQTVETALEEACAEDRKVLVDLGPLEFLDSTGISLLVRVLGGSEAARLSFLPSESSNVSRLLNMTGLDQRMPLSVAKDGPGVLPAA